IGRDSGLVGVAVISPSDIWAIGEYRDANNTDRTFTMHRNGAQWSIDPVPPIGDIDWLHGIAALSSSDVWAVGAVLTNGHNNTLTRHWDGTSWSTVPGPQGCTQ